MHSREHLDERRFAGAVLPDDRMDLARLELQINRFQGMGGSETLVELLENEQRRASRLFVLPLPPCCVWFIDGLDYPEARERIAWRTLVLLADIRGQELLRALGIHVLLGDQVHPRVHILRDLFTL